MPGSPPAPRRLAPVVVALTLATGACAGAGPSPDGTVSSPAPTAGTPTSTTGAGSVPTTSGPTHDDTGAAGDGGSPPPPGWFPTDPATGAVAARWTLEILDRWPHDPSAFTQGLELVDPDGPGPDPAVLLESTGLYGRSDVRVVEPESGTVVSRAALPDDEFGEGLTVAGDTVVQLTWREGRAHLWSLDELLAGTPGADGPVLTYGGEGWGVCALSSDALVTSDGSATLTLRSPTDLAVLAEVRVTRGGRPVTLLNELECVDGWVLANVWQTDEIVVVDPATGTVAATVDATTATNAVDDEVDRAAGDVLNGIAHLGDGTFLLGGKRWPRFFVVELVAAP